MQIMLLRDSVLWAAVAAVGLSIVIVHDPQTAVENKKARARLELFQPSLLK